MNKLKVLLMVLGTVLLFAGCRTTNIDKIETYVKPEIITDNSEPNKSGINRTDAGALENGSSESFSQPVSQLKFYTKAAKARIPIQVIVTNSDNEFYKIEKSIIGDIANAGFEITDNKPFLALAIEGGTLKQYDKYGDYYIYNAEATIVVHRNLYDYTKTKHGNFNMLAENTLVAKGNRKLGEGAAKKSATEELGKAVPRWLIEVCKREMSGVEGEKVYIDRNVFESVFKDVSDEDGTFEPGLVLLLKKISEKPGVLYCIESGRNGKRIIIDVLYRKKNYPNGVFKSEILFEYNGNSKDLDHRVNDLMECLIKAADYNKEQ